MSEGRYCIQKIATQDRMKRLVVWEDTRKCSDSLETLKLMCAKGRNRIFDRETGRVVYEP
jgi:hypothetical protein